MLTSFDYYEPQEENRVVVENKNQELFQKELQIAKRFSDSKKHSQFQSGICPFCESKKVDFFYQKWNVNYLRCNECYSVFSDAKEEDITEYGKLEELISFRKSSRYQEDMANRREEVWNELIDWLMFRSYRYLGKNRNLSVIDYGNRYNGLVRALKNSSLVGKYELRNSILQQDMRELKDADLVLCMDYIQQVSHPYEFLLNLKENIAVGGILFLSTRIGSGFDILTLRENNERIFPYEHNQLPSKEGLKVLLHKAGFEVMEITTPGAFDMNYVMNKKEFLSSNEYFLRYLLDTARPNDIADFQRFLQKSGLSSFSQIIAKRVE